MKRNEVYQVLDGERDYQDKLWGGHKHDSFHSVGDFTIYMQDYLTKAISKYTTESGHEAALEQLRKVVALGIACFEIHGVPDRVKPLNDEYV